LGAVDKRRHARQLLLAEIGERGQERLCATRVQLAAGADPRAAAVARDYLERAGVQVMDPPAAAAQTTGDDASAPTLAVVDSAGVRALAGHPDLDEAAAALAGAFAAVEAIKQALDLPRGAALSVPLLFDRTAPALRDGASSGGTAPAVRGAAPSRGEERA
jgi:hypothetical protein